MSWSTPEEQRVRTIEEVLNDLQTALTNVMSKQQMQQLLLLKQTEVDNLTARVSDLESQITVLQAAQD